MLAQPLKYYSQSSFDRICAKAKELETPFVIIDTATVEEHFDALRSNFPWAEIYYALKANPAHEIIDIVTKKEGGFDLASIYELDKVLSHGTNPAFISYGNTIKKRADIKYFYDAGIRMFVTDSDADLENIATMAPGSKVYVRILTDGTLTADWPLSRKFGCQPDMAMDLLVKAKKLGLEPYGVSFHVGSQQRDIGAWDGAIATVKVIFERLKAENNIELQMVNMGGGFPAHYINQANALEVYAAEIHRFLVEDFGATLPRIILEPGRSLVANAGILVTEVVQVSRKSNTALYRWVYTDVGLFSGMIETLGEAIKYPLYFECSSPGMDYESEEVVIAGPTCDSADILYEDYKYRLPHSLKEGDRLFWFSTGAYTTSYSAVEFNGFPPLKSYFV